MAACCDRATFAGACYLAAGLGVNCVSVGVHGVAERWADGCWRWSAGTGMKQPDRPTWGSYRSEANNSVRAARVMATTAGCCS